MKFRKKPIVIEAIQFWNDKHFPEGVCDCVQGECWGTPHIHTPEGVVEVFKGDWIITGIKGEKYPCHDDVFKMTYEPVD